MCEELQTVDYTKRRRNPAARVVRCPVCGLNGRRVETPITRGTHAGRTRVTIYHVEKFVDLGVCRSVRDYSACYYWRDDPMAGTHQQALKGTEG